MASSRDRTPANNTGNDYYLPGRPPSWLRPSISTQPDFHSLNCSLDILFLIIQHIRRRPLHTEPMPDQTYFQDYRAYNILYQLRRDMMLMDRQHLPSSTFAPICPGRAWTPRTISYGPLSTTYLQQPCRTPQHTTRLPFATSAFRPLTFFTTTHTP